MDLDKIWDLFIEQLGTSIYIKNTYYKKITGIPFLYVEHLLSRECLDKIVLEIQYYSGIAMRGKQLHCKTTYVRETPQMFVFRHRFYVPQRKMFCCGNLCKDCIRFTS